MVDDGRRFVNDATARAPDTSAEIYVLVRPRRIALVEASAGIENAPSHAEENCRTVLDVVGAAGSGSVRILVRRLCRGRFVRKNPRAHVFEPPVRPDDPRPDRGDTRVGVERAYNRVDRPRNHL